MLKAQKRLTKKQIKEDKFLIAAAEGYEWIKKYGIQIGLAIVIVFGLILILHKYTRSKAHRQTQAIERALTALYSNEESAGDLLRGVISEFGGSKVAGEAEFNLGNLKYQQNDIDAAIEHYQTYIKKYADNDIILFGAYNGLGSAHENKRDFQSAVDTYSEYIKKHKKSPLKKMVKFSLARAYMLSENKEGATAAFQDIIDNYPNSKEAEEAKYFINRL